MSRLHRQLAGVIGAVAIAIAAPAPTHAQQAELCYGPPADFSSPPPNNDTVFDCPSLGALTIPQIARSGWRIVRLVPVVAGNGQRSQLLIRGDDTLFRNGFE